MQAAVVAELLRRVWGDAASGARIEPMPADASSRRYYRARAAADVRPSSVVVMVMPEGSGRRDELGAAPRAMRPAEAFLEVRRLLERRGIAVPAALACDDAGRHVLLEDLGDETFFVRLQARPADREQLYERAVDLVAEMHERCAQPEPGCTVYERRFDRALLRDELDHFRQWGLEAVHGTLPPSIRGELDACLDALADEVAALPVGFVHRDVQSRNLMCVGDRLVVIDFQDALVGPDVYDLVALLCDSYVDLDETVQRRLIARYAHRRGLRADDVEARFWLVAAQRKLKDAGRFVYIDRVRGNPGFLRHVPRSLALVGRALGRLERYHALDALLRARWPGFPDSVAAPNAVSGGANGPDRAPARCGPG
ncbi:MAG: phosphotransferase [Myxococcota bacterium]|nr:phosphotransferase [Myxococcota bacterium]